MTTRLQSHFVVANNRQDNVKFVSGDTQKDVTPDNTGNNVDIVEEKRREFNNRVITVSQSKRAIDYLAVIVRAHEEYIISKPNYVLDCLRSIDNQMYIPSTKLFVFSCDKDLPQDVLTYIVDNNWTPIKTDCVAHIHKKDIGLRCLPVDTVWCHFIDCDDICSNGFYEDVYRCINKLEHNHKVGILVPKLVYIDEHVSYQHIVNHEILPNNSNYITSERSNIHIPVYLDRNNLVGYVDTDCVWYVPAMRLVGGNTNSYMARRALSGTHIWDDMMLAKSIVDIGYSTYMMKTVIFKRISRKGEGSRVTNKARHIIDMYGGVYSMMFDIFGCNIITLFGKTYCSERWLQKFAELELPACVDIWWFASYQHKPNVKYLYDMAKRLCRPVNIIVIDVPKAEESAYISRQPSRNNRLLFDDSGVVHRNYIVNFLYNYALRMVSSTKPFTVLLEDDVIPLDNDAIYRMVKTFDIKELFPVGAVGAAVYSVGNHVCGVLHGEDVEKIDKLNVTELFGINGPAAFVVYLTDLVKSLLPINGHQVLVKPELTEDRKIRSVLTDIKINHSYHCWDLEIGTRLRENGFRTFIRTDIRTEHRFTPYCYAVGGTTVEVNKSNVKSFYAEKKNNKQQ